MLKVPSVAEAIEKKRMADCILLDCMPEVASVFAARLLGREDYAGRRYDQPSHEQFAKLSAPYAKFVESAVSGLQVAAKAGEDLDGNDLIARLRELVDQHEADLRAAMTARADRAKLVAPTEVDEIDVFG